MDDDTQIFSRVISAQATHQSFLNATQQNLNYYFFGSDVSIISDTIASSYATINLVQALATYTPKAFNIYQILIGSFIDEIANSDLDCQVEPHPIKQREPYDSFADQLEDYLEEAHRISNQSALKRAIAFSLLMHGQFGLYTNGQRYWPLSAYECFVGDPNIRNSEDQPFLVRKTNPTKMSLRTRLTKEDYARLDQLTNTIPVLDPVPLYDVWVKDLNQNIVYTEGGDVVYRQSFPKPGRYPIFISSDSELFTSFYSQPVANQMRILQDKYKDASENIENNAKSIGNPILTYDKDSGIDVEQLKSALRFGYKRIILEKFREGNIEFHAPGALPQYALELPERIQLLMMRRLGVTEAFFGSMTSGVRERGAITNLLRTSFRRLATIATTIENVFSGVDNYMIDYAQQHQFKLKEENPTLNVEQIFGDGKVRYVATEKFSGFSTQDSMEEKNLAMSENSRKLIGQEETLRRLGHKHPRRVMAQIKREQIELAKVQQELQAGQQEPVKPDFVSSIFSRLRGKLEFKYYVMPLDGNNEKFLVRCSNTDLPTVGFLLSDIADRVLVQPTKKNEPKPVEQSQIEEPEKEIVEPLPQVPEQEGVPSPGQPQPAAPGQPQPGQPQPGQPAIDMSRLMATRPVEASAGGGSKKKQFKDSTGFSEERLKNLVLRTHVLKNPDKFLKLPGFYMVEPHSADVYSGRKSLLIKPKRFSMTNKPYLLCGKKVYGVIIIRDVVETFNFDATRRFHLITPTERTRWWGNKPLYLYMFEFHPFPEPYDYQIPNGVQSFIKAPVKIKQRLDSKNKKEKA